MTIFSDTILKVIFDYRQLLKRHLKVGERRAKLKALGLSSECDPTDEVALYALAEVIAKDLEGSLASLPAGYYTYSGMQKFFEHLNALLSEYKIEEGRVIHKTQHASRALLHVIQNLMHSGSKLSLAIRDKSLSCARVVAAYGSSEQHKHYRETLQKYRNLNEVFCGQLLQEFEEAL